MKKTKLLTSLAALGLVISLGACDTTTQECEECPTCPEVTEPTDEEDEAWATTPGELIEMAAEAKNYSVTIEVDYYESANKMSAEDWDRLFVLDDALYEFYDPDNENASLWDDENDTWAEGGEERYAELYAEFLELYDEYYALYYDYTVETVVTDMYVDEDYLLVVDYDVVEDEETGEESLEYSDLTLFVNDEGGVWYYVSPYTSRGATYSYAYAYYEGDTWDDFDYTLFHADVFDFDNAFEYYASGTLGGIPCTAWTMSESAEWWGVDTYLARMLGGYQWANITWNLSYYYHYLTYFMEDYQEMLSNYYYGGTTYDYTGNPFSPTITAYYYVEEDIYFDLYDVGTTDKSDFVNAAQAWFQDDINGLHDVESEEGDGSSSSSGN